MEENQRIFKKGSESSEKVTINRVINYAEGLIEVCVKTGDDYYYREVSARNYVDKYGNDIFKPLYVIDNLEDLSDFRGFEAILESTNGDTFYLRRGEILDYGFKYTVWDCKESCEVYTNWGEGNTYRKESYAAEHIKLVAHFKNGESILGISGFIPLGEEEVLSNTEILRSNGSEYLNGVRKLFYGDDETEVRVYSEWVKATEDNRKLCNDIIEYMCADLVGEYYEGLGTTFWRGVVQGDGKYIRVALTECTDN